MTTPGALDGVVVADFSRVLAGPYATMLLGRPRRRGRQGRAPGRRRRHPALGSAVRRRRAGDVLHRRSTATSARWRSTSATPEGRAAGTRARAARRRHGRELQAGHARPDRASATTSSRPSNPRLVLCSISGFGSGEGATLPGLRPAGAGDGRADVGDRSRLRRTRPRSGSRSSTSSPGCTPSYGILAALRHRDRTGEGQHVEVNLLSSLLSALVNQTSAYVAGRCRAGHPRQRPPVHRALRGLRHRRPPARARCRQRPPVPCAVRVLGRRGRCRRRAVRHEPGAGRPPRPTLRPPLEAALAAHGASTGSAQLTAAGVPCGPINDVARAFDARRRRWVSIPVVDVPGTDVPQVANPLRMSATPPTYRSAPPRSVLGAR